MKYGKHQILQKCLFGREKRFQSFWFVSGAVVAMYIMVLLALLNAVRRWILYVALCIGHRRLLNRTRRLQVLILRGLLKGLSRKRSIVTPSNVFRSVRRPMLSYVFSISTNTWTRQQPKQKEKDVLV